MPETHAVQDDCTAASICCTCLKAKQVILSYLSRPITAAACPCISQRILLQQTVCGDVGKWFFFLELHRMMLLSSVLYVLLQTVGHWHTFHCVGSAPAPMDLKSNNDYKYEVLTLDVCMRLCQASTAAVFSSCVFRGLWKVTTCSAGLRSGVKKTSCCIVQETRN